MQLAPGRYLIYVSTFFKCTHSRDIDHYGVGVLSDHECHLAPVDMEPDQALAAILETHALQSYESQPTPVKSVHISFDIKSKLLQPFGFILLSNKCQ